MPSEVSTVTGEPSVEVLIRELADAREQQAATADILAAMSNSPTDPYRAFADIAASAARLCEAQNTTLVELADDKLRLLANYGPLPTVAQVGQPLHGLPFNRGFVTARAIIDKTTIHVADVQTETNEYPESSEWARRAGHRTIVAVPLMRAGEAIGAIVIRRAHVRPFTDRQIALLKIFADQAVIAIENARLFEAEQASKRELQESLEYQTAMGEVLGVIARAPGDLQQVLDAVAESAGRVCRAAEVRVFRLEGDKLRRAALVGRLRLSDYVGVSPNVPLSRGSVTGRAILDRRSIHVTDLAAEIGSEYPDVAAIQKAIGHRTTLATPLLRDGAVLGAILVLRKVVAPFSDKQIKLLETFADQAVIAIENTRLFEAEQASKRELQESLEYQTATSEVLGVISRSKFDLQPVLDTIAKIASGLCAAEDVAILLRESGVLRIAAHDGTIKPQLNIEIPVERGWVAGRTVVDRQPIHVPDVTVAGDEFPRGREIALRLGIRTSLGIPLLREDVAIGCLLLRRKVVRPFDEKQIALLQIFADQAVIAIENTRLFEEVQARTKELQDSLDRQTATSEVLGVISRSPNE